MFSNGFRGTKPSSELTEYQRLVQNIDNVILCVAEAERMVDQIGQDLVKEVTIPKTGQARKRRSGSTVSYGDRRKLYKF